MSGASTPARHENDFVLFLGLDQHVDNGQHRISPPIDDALPADLDHVDLGLHAEIFLGFRCLQEFLAYQGFTHEG
jgi:hypothetical protein